MHNISNGSRSSDVDTKRPVKRPRTPQPQLSSSLVVPLISPLPRYLSPVLDEFSLRKTPSRGGTTSPAPARGVRKRLHLYRNFDHAVTLFKQSKNIVVLTGAGISTSVGIPDFRSDRGLYQQLSKDLGITEAEEFFSRDYFIHNTDQFFRYVRRVIPEAVIGADGFFKSVSSAKAAGDGKVAVPRFSLTHAFLALLYSKQKLLTNYTQNIDGLETAAGVPHTKFIQCHGSWETASCMTCGRSSAARKYLPVVFSGNIPFCKCKLETEHKGKKKSKKAGKKRGWDEFDSDHSSDDGTRAPKGLLKPDITFFNERLSGSYDARLDQDKQKIDLLVIIGTSLKVGPVQDMLYQISPKVPQIFISRERFSGALCNLPGVQVDIELLGECDVVVEELCRRAGWSAELEALCWEEGQAEVKLSGTHSVKDATVVADQLAKSSNDGIGAPRSVGDRPGPQKKPKVQNGEATDKNSQLGTGKTLDNVTKVYAASAAENNESRSIAPVSRIPVLGSNLKLESVPSPGDSDNETRSANAELKDIKQSASQGTKEAEQAMDLVKVELVEGTSHQWRISRK